MHLNETFRLWGQTPVVQSIWISAGWPAARMSECGREGIVRFPLLTQVWRDIFHHLVNLFEGESFRLGYEYKGEDGAEETGRAPDEEDSDAKIPLVLVDDEGDDDCNYAVPEPIGGGRKSDAFASDFELENLADDYPC